MANTRTVGICEFNPVPVGFFKQIYEYISTLANRSLNHIPIQTVYKCQRFQVGVQLQRDQF